MYLRLFRTGRRIRSKYFNVIFAPGNGRGARLGVAVSKRFVAQAVDRNRLKRIVRESFRLHAAGLADHDVIVQANAPAARAASPQLFATLAHAWSAIAESTEPSKSPS